MNLNNLSWKYSNPHILEFKVSSDDIDILGHVNNKVYLNWCEHVSWDHSAKLGITPDTYKKINDQWFISSRVEESSWEHNVPKFINTKAKK